MSRPANHGSRPTCRPDRLTFGLREQDYVQLAIVALPAGIDPDALKVRLYDNYHIEVPVTEHLGQAFLRISVQGYNIQSDLDALVNAVVALISPES